MLHRLFTSLLPSLPGDGKILALDINCENYEIFALLRKLVLLVKFYGSFDFIFVDADKDNYHKRLIDLVKIPGIIGYDNTL
ncbi:O-methyltransferase, family 3 [Cynara cardunculus var. scolymus]|uniref:caffeoyl-CoA O-methyltransferase n=1 Tax=Cynara cardunculus var. scolymus TaxID=59895 RepID=A0A118K5F3_CYNCS|nr:O-methyltransferase, family 3 [Cynara cardunculus var. scolymus]